MDITHNLKFQIHGLLVLATSLLSPVICSACSQCLCNIPAKCLCNIPAIFNFGDSNSDTGGFAAAFVQPPPPYGRTYFEGQTGRERFSDGRLIIDFLAASLGLPYLRPHLQSVGTNFRRGANFAVAGAKIRAPNTTLISQGGASPISLNYQLEQFSDFYRRSQLLRAQGGIIAELFPKEEDFSKALYTIDIGQNEFLYKVNIMTPEQLKEIVPETVQQLSNVIQRLYAKVGRSFWVHNIGPLGCMPSVLQYLKLTAADIDEYGCAIPFNEVAQHFNLQLKEAVIHLRNILQLAAITYVDIYSVKQSLIIQAKKLGFDDPFLTCCGYGGGKYNYNKLLECGSKEIIDGTEVIVANSCKDPSSAISWDGIHYTEAANKWIFENIVSGSFTYPPNIPLNLACNR